MVESREVTLNLIRMWTHPGVSAPHARCVRPSCPVCPTFVCGVGARQGGDHAAGLEYSAVRAPSALGENAEFDKLADGIVRSLKGLASAFGKSADRDIGVGDEGLGDLANEAGDACGPQQGEVPRLHIKQRIDASGRVGGRCLKPGGGGTGWTWRGASSTEVQLCFNSGSPDSTQLQLARVVSRLRARCVPARGMDTDGGTALARGITFHRACPANRAKVTSPDRAVGEREEWAVGDLTMAVPLADGSEVLVAVNPKDVSEDLVLAAATDPYQIAARATETLEELLEKITPTVQAVSEWVRARSPDECGVEFGLKLGGEAGVIVAKGTAEVNFMVKLTWKKTP